MRVWLNIFCSLPLMLTGCLSGANPGQPGSAGSALSPAEVSLATALAGFAQGILWSDEEGPGSERALDYFQAAFAADPGNHELASRVAVAALHRKDAETAVSALEASFRADPSDYRRTVDLAAIYQTAERYGDAAQYYRKALAIQDSPTAVYLALSGILFQQDKDDEALAILGQGHSKAGEPHLLAMYLYDQARRFVAHGAFPRAIACFELLRAWDEVRKPEIQLILAELYTLAERDAEASAVLEDALALPDPSPEVYTALALSALRRHRTEYAEEVLEAARERFESSPDVLYSIGAIYGEMGRHDRTVTLLEQAREIARAAADADSPPVFSESFYLQLGAAYERLGRSAVAETVFEECLAIYPDSHRVLNYLAYMWAEENRNLEQALEYSLRSLGLEPENGAYTDTLGWIRFHLGQLEQALEIITRARQLAGDDSEILLHLGDIHEALGNLDEAIALWRMSIEGDPSPSNRAAGQLRRHGKH